MHEPLTTATFHGGFRRLRKLVHLVTFMSGDRSAFQKPARQVAATVKRYNGLTVNKLNIKEIWKK
jgi:hypothetical protein